MRIVTWTTTTNVLGSERRGIQWRAIVADRSRAACARALGVSSRPGSERPKGTS